MGVKVPAQANEARSSRDAWLRRVCPCVPACLTTGTKDNAMQTTRRKALFVLTNATPAPPRRPTIVIQEHRQPLALQLLPHNIHVLQDGGMAGLRGWGRTGGRAVGDFALSPRWQHAVETAQRTRHSSNAAASSAVSCGGCGGWCWRGGSAEASSEAEGRMLPTVAVPSRRRSASTSSRTSNEAR